MSILASTPSPYKSYVYEKDPSIRITSISLPVAIKIFARRLEKVYLNFYYFQHPDEIITTSEDGKQHKVDVKLPDFIIKANSACDIYQALFQDDIKNSQDDIGLVAHWIEVFEHEWQNELNEMKQKEIRKGIIPLRNKKPQIKWYPLPEISTDKMKKMIGKEKEQMPSLESIHKDEKDSEKSNIFKPAISWADDVEEEFGEYFSLYKDNGHTIQEQETSVHFQNSSADASLERSTSKETEAGQSESGSLSQDNEQNCESEFVRKHITTIGEIVNLSPSDIDCVEDKSGDNNAQNIKIGPMLETPNIVPTPGQVTLVGEGTKVNETVLHENQQNETHNERLQTNKDLENNQAVIKDIQPVSVEVNPEEMKNSMNEIKKGNYETNIKEKDKIEEQIKSFEGHKASENKKETPEESEQEESQEKKIAGEISNVTSMKQHKGGFDDQSIGNAPEDIGDKFEFERRNSRIGISETNLINQDGKAIQQKPEQNSVGERPIYISHTFKWNHGGNKVYLAGSFYTPPYPCWSPIYMKKNESSEFEITIMLKPDQEYLYKFIIDGEWRTKPGDPVIQDEYGNENHSVIFSLNEHGKPMLAAKECQTFPCTYFVLQKPGGDEREQDESEFMGSKREQNQDMADLKENVSHLLYEHAKFIYKELEKEFETRNKLFEMDKVPHISAAPTGKMKKTGQKKRYHEHKLERHDHSLCDGSLANRERTVNKMRKVMNRWEVVLTVIKDAGWLH